MSTTPTTTPEPIYIREPRNGFGLTAVILGVIGLLFGLIPLTGFIAFGLGFGAFVFALANRGRLKRGKATNGKSTWTGLVAGLLAMALGVWGMVIVFTAANDLGNNLDCIDKAKTVQQMNACD
jgi:hypothetical protein